MSLQIHETKITSIEKKIRGFVNQNIQNWFEDTVMREVYSAVEAADMPRSFIDHIKLEGAVEFSRDRITFKLINDLKNREGKPIAKFLEFGTETHWIQPKDPKGVLAFPAPGNAQHGRAIYFKSSKTSPGDILFSKGHYVSGIFGYEAMTNGTRRGKERLHKKILRELGTFRKTLNEPGVKIKI